MVKQKPYYTFPAPDLSAVSLSKTQNSQPQTPISKDVDRYGSAIIIYENGLATYALPFSLENSLGITVLTDPVLLMLKSAKDASYKTTELRRRFPSSDGRQYVEVPAWVFNPYIESKLGAVIMLHTALEACINRIIPMDASYQKKKSNPELPLGREECIRLGFTEKFTQVVKSTTGIDFHQINQTTYVRLKDFTKLRDDLAHLKPATTESKNYYFPVFQRLIKLNIEEAFDDVALYMNTFFPGFVELTPTPQLNDYDCSVVAGGGLEPTE